jgi:hypothetical protein
VADFFISFSDNIQETFGLTPIEAMAAGLPCVVTDWDGYKDTVRHGIDGFRIPTMAPPPGEGGDFAYWFDNHWLNYDNYVGAVGQLTAIDYGEAAQAISALVDDPDLRRRMGEAASRRAREVFDWSAIIPQYQALWAEQNARRLTAGPEAATRDNPYRPDPFTLFQSYPTRHLSARTPVALAPGMSWEIAEPLLKSELVAYSNFNRPTLDEVRLMIAHLAETGGSTVAQTSQVGRPERGPFIARGLLWLARYGVVVLGQEG